MSRKIVILTVLVFILLPVFAQAVSWWPLVPCGTSVNPEPCNRCDLFKLLKNIIDFVLMGLMPPVAAILFVWGGFLILMGGANPGWITQGKSIFWNTAIGVAIILASWLITNSIIRSLAADNVATEWWKFSCSVMVGGGPIGGVLAVTISSLSDAVEGTVYAQTIEASGGTTPYTFSITAGSLPPGLSLDQFIGITGTPTTVGTSTFTVKVTDNSTPQQSATKQLTIKVATQAASVIISNVVSSDISNDSVTITWMTDKPSTSQVLFGTTTAYGSATSIDSNLVTNHTAVLIGLIPGTTYNFQTTSSITGFTAKSSNNIFKTTGTVVQNLSITTASLSDASQNTSYSQSLSATGGTAPYTWFVAFGALPAGLNVSGTNISGMPTTTGTSTFTVKVTDNSTPQQSATKQLSIVVAGTGTGGVVCLQSNLNLCQAQSMSCGASTCNQYISSINKYAGGAASANLLKAIMIKESACNVNAASGFDSFGLMQLRPATANIYKSRCGVTANITGAWLTTSANADASICIAAEYIKALAQTSCGNNTRGIAAGYNGGSGACGNSTDCAGENSCAGGPKKRWECLYDDPQHTVCNGGNNILDGYNQTRDYVVKVLYCYNNPGF